MWNLQCLSDSILEEPLPGDKIRLPSDILNQYLETNQHEPTFPLSFKLSFVSRNITREIITSVLDFSADQDTVVVPQWIIDNLCPLQMGDTVSISVYSGGYTEKTIVKGTTVRLRPHSKEFLNISDHRALLETQLKEFGILNQYTTIKINYFDDQFDIDIIETQPESIINIVDTDLQVDFDPPVDYIDDHDELSEDSNEQMQVNNEKDSLVTTIPEHTQDQDNYQVRPACSVNAVNMPLIEEAPIPPMDMSPVNKTEEVSNRGFVPFSGKGNRLGS